MPFYLRKRQMLLTQGFRASPTGLFEDDHGRVSHTISSSVSLPSRRFSRVPPSVRNSVRDDLLTVCVKYATCLLVEIHRVCFQICFSPAGLLWGRIAVIWTMATFSEQSFGVPRMLSRREDGANSDL